MPTITLTWGWNPDRTIAEVLVQIFIGLMSEAHSYLFNVFSGASRCGAFAGFLVGALTGGELAGLVATGAL